MNEIFDPKTCRACKGSGELKCPACEGNGNVIGYKVEDADTSEDASRPVVPITTSEFGIPDASAFRKSLDACNQDGTPISVIFLDLDNFKSVNDNHDHKVGDEVIEEALTVVQGVIDLKGSLYHRSGDEMLVLLPNFNDVEAQAVGERIRVAIENHEFPVIGKGHVTATLGISTYPDSCQNSDELEVQADRAAMSAKKRGKNMVVHASQLDTSRE
jgi:diguanylate cyclase (GGDEF)-like protein